MQPAICTVAAVLVLVSDLQGVSAEWKGENVRDLHQQYYNIFKHGNRNAASHLWSKFLLDRSHEMTHDKLTYMFSGFCAVSGSPVNPQDRTRYRLNLDKVGGGKHRGYMYYCCWPCVCDTQDFIKVDTKNITIKGGEVRQYHFAVLGNPCDHPEELKRPFTQPFYGRGETTLEREAAEVRCDRDGNLEGAHLSDHGYIIISMFFDENPTFNSMDESMFEGHCKQRADHGYNSGMGEIFRKVAAISPVQLGAVAGTQSDSDKPGQLLSDAAFRTECESQTCILAFLPHILDGGSAARNELLSTLGAVRRMSRAENIPVSFMWLQGGDQIEHEEKFSLAFGWPAVIAINLKKDRYGIHRGTFNKESLQGFIKSLMMGEVPLHPLPQGLAKFPDSKPWDGEDTVQESDLSKEKCNNNSECVSESDQIYN